MSRIQRHADDLLQQRGRTHWRDDDLPEQVLSLLPGALAAASTPEFLRGAHRAADFNGTGVQAGRLIRSWMLPITCPVPDPADPGNWNTHVGGSWVHSESGGHQRRGERRRIHDSHGPRLRLC